MVSCVDERNVERVHQSADQRYEIAYSFGAVFPKKGKGASRALPHADTDVMQLHIDEISRHAAKIVHAVPLLDRAGWHMTVIYVVPFAAPRLRTVSAQGVH